MAVFGEVREIIDLPKGVRILNDRPAITSVSKISRFHRSNDELDPKVLRLGFHDGDVLGMTVLRKKWSEKVDEKASEINLVNKEFILGLLVGDGMCHGHCFRSGSGFVQK